MRMVLLVLIGVIACKGKPREEGPPPPPPPPRVAPDLGQAKTTLGCLFDRARYPRDVLQALKDAAPVPIVRMAAFAAVERARRDGESPAEVVLADALGVLGDLDDVDGLRAAFAMVDASPARSPLLFGHAAPLRARAGLPTRPEDEAPDRAAVVRELAIAGRIPEATQRFAALSAGDIGESYQAEPYLGALVALGRGAEAKAMIAKQPAENRLRLAGVWLDVVLRQRAPVADALAVALAELAAAPERGLLMFPERALLARAVRMGRAAELAPLYRVLLPMLTAGGKNPGLADLAWAYAVAIGDTASATKLGGDPRLAAHVAVRTGPLDAALAAALAGKGSTVDDLAYVWARSIAADADPTFGARLASAVCPKTPPRRPATPARAGLTLTVTEKPRKKQFECANHDVVVRLVEGKATVAEAVLAGECQGACTASERREGEARLAEIEKEIEAGTASESETDYNFTSCLFSGARAGRSETVGDRQVAVIVNHYIGAHDIDKDSYLLALEVCGTLHQTTAFGGMYAGSFGQDDLKLRRDGDRILVEVATERWRGVVFRLTLPACPGTPIEEVLETE